MTESLKDLPAWLEQAWLDRYLARDLDPDETRAFEAYLLTQPALIAQVEDDSDLRAALHQASAAGVDIAPDLDPAVEARRARRRGTRRWLTPVALAACVALGAGLGLQLGGDGVSADRAGDGWVANPTRILFDTLRGDQDAPRVIAGDPQSPWILVEIGVPTGAEQITLEIPGGRSLPLSPTPDGFVGALLQRRQAAQLSRLTLRFVVAGVARERVLDFPQVATDAPSQPR